jgi:hypothetical protein
MTLGYRIEADGAAVVYSCDHEPFSETLWHESPVLGHAESIVHEGDRRHARFMEGASVVIHDAQYTPEEYPSKKNWGHSTYEYAVELAAAAGVRQLVLTHHDPTHDDAFVEEIEKRARECAKQLGGVVEVCCAYEGLNLVVEPRDAVRLAPMPSAPHEGGDPNAPPYPGQRTTTRTSVPRKPCTEPGRHIVVEASSGRRHLRQSPRKRPIFWCWTC